MAVKELEARGATAVRRGTLITASTDLGNVSQRYPTVALDFPVSDEDVPGHSIKMTEASVSEYAHSSALKTAQAIAAIALATAKRKSALVDSRLGHTQDEGPFGYLRREWDESKASMTELLTQTAASRSIIAYSEVGRRVSPLKFDPRSDALFAMLGEISESSNRAGNGMLSAVVV